MEVSGAEGKLIITKCEFTPSVHINKLKRPQERISRS